MISRHAGHWGVAVVLLVGASALAQPAHTTTRLTFYASSAVVSGSVQGLTPDLNGDLTDPATGRTFSRYDVPTAGGHGFTQVDIVYADAQVCVGSVAILNVDVLTNALSTLATSGFVTPGDACADFWVAPAVLSQNQAFITPGLTVVRGPMQRRDGTTVEVVGHRTMGPTSTSQATYELATGYRLVASTAAQGGAIATLGPGNVVTPGTGSSTLTFTELVNVRTYQLPTASAVLPDHVRGVRELVYDCVSGTSLGEAVSELPCDARFTVEAGGPQWLSLKSVTRLHNPITGSADVSESSAVIAMGMSAGLFLAPEVLAVLTPQQEVDADPVTGARTVVHSATSDSVTLAVLAKGENAWLRYDRASGWLLETYQERAAGAATSYLRLRLATVN